MKFAFTSFALFALLSTSIAEENPTFSDNGVMQVGNTAWGTLLMGSSWQSNKQANCFKLTSAENGNYKGAFYGKQQTFFSILRNKFKAQMRMR